MYSDVIRRLRTERGMTRQDLADRMGVSQTAIYKWETGATQPDIRALTALAELFGVTIDELCDRKTRPAPADMTVMARAFSRLSDEERAMYLALGRTLYAHAFREDAE